MDSTVPFTTLGSGDCRRYTIPVGCTNGYDLDLLNIMTRFCVHFPSRNIVLVRCTFVIAQVSRFAPVV